MTQQPYIADRTAPAASDLCSTALALFDAAAATHGLSAQLRPLLALAASCYAAARQAGDDRPDRLGRDMALDLPLRGLSASERAIAAGAVAFQREKVKPKREPVFLRLDKKERRAAFRLAAILRVAAGLGGDAGVYVRAGDESDGAVVVVGGVGAAERAAGAEERAALWREKIGSLTLRVAEAGEQPHASVNGASDGAARLGLHPLGASISSEGSSGLGLPALVVGQPVGGEPVAESARRVLRRFFDKLLAREDAVLKAEDAEDVHQMRVATRRLRASLQVAEGVYDPKLIRRFRGGLRRIARSLGAVRDGDVFLTHVAAYRDSLPEDERNTLTPLISAVEAERALAREALLDELRSKQYEQFKRAFAVFLTTPAEGVLPPPEPGITQRVRDFAGSAIWRRYELWRAYETVISNATDEPMHQARIAGKHLRYTLEFFADALGPNVAQALNPLVALQESLGALQDGVTAREHVAALGLAADPGAQQYLAARAAERAGLLAELPQRWEKVASATYRRRLFELIVKM